MREPVEIRLTAKTPEAAEAVRLLLDTLLNIEGSAATASIGHPSPGRKGGYLAYGYITVDLPDQPQPPEHGGRRGNAGR